MIANKYLSVGLIAICLALATQPAQANWIQDSKSGGQKVFQAAFDTWSESDLRAYLLERGVVSPQSTKEQLVVLAKQDYAAVSASALSATAQASKAANEAAQSAYSFASSIESVASASASSASAYVDGTASGISKDASKSASSASGQAASAATQASKSAQSVAAEASKSANAAYAQVTNNFDANKDYVWSTWKDSELRKWLIDNNVIKSDYEAKRDELVSTAEKYSNTLTDQGRAYYAWSDAKLKEYLYAVGLSKTPQTREQLLQEVQSRFVPQKGFIDQIRDGVKSAIAGAQDAINHQGQSASDAAVSATDAAASVASSASARVHNEL
ncbi:unnamed protein product [Sympodiomycopsis kandeliae]